MKDGALCRFGNRETVFADELGCTLFGTTEHAASGTTNGEPLDSRREHIDGTGEDGLGTDCPCRSATTHDLADSTSQDVLDVHKAGADFFDMARSTNGKGSRGIRSEHAKSTHQECLVCGEVDGNVAKYLESAGYGWGDLLTDAEEEVLALSLGTRHLELRRVLGEC